MDQINKVKELTGIIAKLMEITTDTIAKNQQDTVQTYSYDYRNM